MRVFKLLWLLFIIFGFFACADNAPDDKVPDPAKKMLLTAVEKFNTAFQEGNTAILESMITENYIHTNGASSPVGKKEWVQYLRKRENEITSGTLKVIAYTMNEMEITFHSHIAIVTGKIHVHGEKEGITHKDEYRVTHVWVYEKGTWKRAGFHDGKIK
ncbi:nuclear transport factor 2 family protein [Ascidiimonas aurantiaca]|uniref:nuclear transport factor 2 family protein n=1 Tax=Ascidiimonas aurantiaca TaxID=1685432 RepID=UPI0030EEFDE2